MIQKIILFSIVLFLMSACTSSYIQNKDESIAPDKKSGIKSKQAQSEEGLDLSNLQLEKIPAYVFKEIDTKNLNISGNQITGAIQSEIRNLKNLKTLNASNNLMTGVPAEIGQLQNLELLDLSNNQLTGLPYEIGNLKNLKVLNISGNDYSDIDLEIISENLSEKVDIIK